MKTPTPAVDSNGILTVTVDFNGVTDLDPTPANGLCQPHQFCKQNGNSCVSALEKSDPLFAESTAVCGQWAVKDLDCPVKGCFGFSFTLPYTADGTYHRPDPQPFPTAADPAHQPDWTTKFTRTSTAPDGFAATPAPACYYSKLPGTDCPVP